MRVRRTASLLLLLLGAACSGGATGTIPPAPVRTVDYNEVATGVTKDGLPITVTTVSIVRVEKDTQGNLGGYSSENKMQVTRGGILFSLKSSDTPNAFGCAIDVDSYESFGCYFGSASLVDLDRDGEPEIISEWEQGGSGGYESVHAYRWDGSAYVLLGVFTGMQLRYEVQDLDRDGRRELILDYNVGPDRNSVPWVDIYALSDGKLFSVNKQYPAYYRDLLAQYQVRLPEMQRDAEALAELEKRIGMAQAIVNGKAP